jgi:hypothetical protein
VIKEPSLLDAWSADEPVADRERIPPWASDSTWMKRWVKEYLADWEALLERHNRVHHDDVKTSDPPSSTDILWATLKAEYDGDLEPLKKLYPQHAEFIRDRKRGRGKHLRKPNPRLEKALFAVVMIRDLWIETYGKWKRFGIRPTAEEIAGEFCGIHKVSVENAVKKGRLPYDYDEDDE